MAEKDYAWKVILKEKSSKETLVRGIMSFHVLYVRPEQTIEDCMALMTGRSQGAATSYTSPATHGMATTRSISRRRCSPAC
jgi:predicted transcriptional regulator